jgi:uncharacterized protein YlbG (UPF0298 family)
MPNGSSVIYYRLNFGAGRWWCRFSVQLKNDVKVYMEPIKALNFRNRSILFCCRHDVSHDVTRWQSLHYVVSVKLQAVSCIHTLYKLELSPQASRRLG